MELPLSVLEGLVGGYLGTVVFGKLMKVKENSTAACTWMLTLVEKKTPDLDAIKIAARTPEKSPPSWRANCRIAYPESPPGVCPAVDL